LGGPSILNMEGPPIFVLLCIFRVRAFFRYNSLMFKRPFFWLGLLFGGLASFGLRQFWKLPMQEAKPETLLDSVEEAVVVYNSAGATIYTNAAARSLLGTEAGALQNLCYPSGQKVPPGQLPLMRARRSGKAVQGEGYLCVSSMGATRVLDIGARPLADGRVVVTARDTTALEEGRARQTTLGKREQVLRTLCQRLNAATDAQNLAQAVAECALALIGGASSVRARLYLYDSEITRLTRLASAPQDRPKRPRSHRDALLPVFPFDAASPLLWSLYIDRQPITTGDVTSDSRFQGSIDDDNLGSACALPLLAGGAALGHLSLTCRAVDAFEETDLRDSLSLLASIAALALAGPQQAAQAASLGEQVEALREVVQTIVAGGEEGMLADLVSRHVCRVTGAEVCTLARQSEGGLHAIGAKYRDALLFPERHASGDSLFIDTAVLDAVQTGKMVQRTGLTNPSFEAGPWRAFAGQSGRHSLLCVPLAAGQGALVLYRSGDTPFPETQTKFVEALAALVSAALPTAIRTAAHEDS